MSVSIYSTFLIHESCLDSNLTFVYTAFKASRIYLSSDLAAYQVPHLQLRPVMAK